VDLGRRQKATAQQTIGVQFQKPLTFLYVTLAPRHTLGATGIDQIDLQTVAFEHIMHGDPVDASRLHHYGFHPTAFQPLRHLFQGCRPGSELAYRSRIASRRYRHVVAFVAHINTRGMGMDNLQSRIRGVQTMFQFSPLLTVARQLSIA
jgi:hypothetical protein